MTEPTGEQPPTSEEDLAPLLSPGTVLDRYVIQRMLGRGGMGEVYEAVHQDIKKRVAIKTLDPSAARSAEARARFMREGEAASRIQHPNIVSVSDVGNRDGLLYLVMEYLDGEDLDARLAREGSLTPEQTADVMVPVLAAVSTAHVAGIVHRDLKPSNIYLALNPHGDVQPKVLDFGISKLTDASGQGNNLTRTSAVVGTPLYMSPEQVKSSKSSDARSDQYSLGVILYQCLTGAAPYQADTVFELMTLIVGGQFAPIETLAPGLPADLVAIVNRSMSSDPSARFASVADMGRALLPFAGEDVRILFRKAFGGADATAQRKAVTEETAPKAVPRAHAEQFASTLGHAVIERPTVEAAAPAPRAKTSRLALAGVGLLLGVGAAAGVLRIVSGGETSPASGRPASANVAPSASAPAPSASVAPAVPVPAVAASAAPSADPSIVPPVVASASASASASAAPSAVPSASAAVVASAAPSAPAAEGHHEHHASRAAHGGSSHGSSSDTRAPASGGAARTANGAPILR